MTVETVSSADSLREFEIGLLGLAETERADFQQVEQLLRAAVAEERTLASSGLHTPAGLAQLPKPRREAAIQRLTAIERAAQADRGRLDASREGIEAGRIVRGDDGGYSEAQTSEPTPVSETREAEIRREFRALDAGTQVVVIDRALKNGDVELLRALERAPKCMPVLSDTTTRAIRRGRLELAGFESEYRRLGEQLEQRQRLVTKARRALGISE